MILAAALVLHIVSETLDDATKGTRDEWVTSSLQRREIVDHVRDQSLTVVDGKRGWLRDWNGYVAPLEASDLRMQTDLAFVHSMRALHERGAKSGDCETFHPADVITICRDANGLPQRAELPTFDGTLTITFSDWRDVHGIKFPFAEKRTDGINTTTITVKSVDVNPRQRVDFTKPAAGPNDAFFLNGKRSVTVPFNFDNHHIMVKTSVNGSEPLWFIVDTGANFLCLNATRIAAMHVSSTYGGLQTEGGGTSTGGAWAADVTQRVGDVEVRNQHAAILPLHGLERLYGVPLGGLLGYDLLSRFVVVIDYGAQTLTFLDPKSFRYDGRGTRVPLTMIGQQPYFAGSIRVGDESIPTWYILDTGAADTITFTTPFVTAHKLIDRAGDPRREKKTVAGVEGEFYTPTNVRGMIDAITVGPVTLSHVPVNLSANTKGAYNSATFSGNIGETILDKFSRVILDYSRDEMIVEPSPRLLDHGQPMHERTSFGLTVLADGDDFGTFRVTAVGASSPAAKAGFAKGDVIAAVDGAKPESLARLKELLTENGTKHAFTVDRAGAAVTISATMEQVPISGLR